LRNVCSIIVSRKISKRLKAVCAPCPVCLDEGAAVVQKWLLRVRSGLAIRPEDQFKILEAEDLDDPLMVKSRRKVNPILGDPVVEKVVIGHEKEDEMWRGQRVNWVNGKYHAKYPLTLCEAWADMTMALYHCAYRRPRCGGGEEFQQTDCA
jgi:hypothetical protein